MGSDEAAASLPHGTFDAAFLNGALEHTDPLALLRKVRAALRPGGDLVVVVGDDSGDARRAAPRATPSPRFP